MNGWVHPKRRQPGQVACFNVYPEPGRSRLFFRVRVFASQRAMRRYVNHGPLPARLGRYGVALCTTWTVARFTSGRERILPEMGEILIPVRRMRTEVITHECTHAAVGWAQRVGINPLDQKVERGTRRLASPSEERFCYGLGQMARQVVHQGFQRGLIK